MERKIIKCISTIEEFNIKDFEKLGIGVELQDFTWPDALDVGWEENITKYKKTLESFSNILSLHGPFLDLKPVSPDKIIREVSFNRYLTALTIGKELDVDYIIFHSQINPWLNEPRIKEINNNLNKEFWRDILKKIDGFNGTILIENIFENDPILLKELIDTINLPNIKICLDIGHAKLRTNKDLENWVKILKDHIEYIHLHWNNGLYDQHSRPSDENIKYIKSLLEEYSLNPIIALEYKADNLQEEINRVKNIFNS